MDRRFIMNFSNLIKIILTCLVVLTILICFVCCNNSFSIKDDYYDSNGKINYNNIHYFVHDGFWVNEDTAYYAKNVLYSDTYYYANKLGKHRMFSDIDFDLINGVDGSIYGLQAYGNDIYLLHKNEDMTTNSFYLSSKKKKDYGLLFQTNEDVYEWAVINNKIVYSAIGKENHDIYSLWLYDIDTEKNTMIDEEIVGFGIVNNGIMYVKQEDGSKKSLYKYSFDNNESHLLYLFNGSFTSNTEYNFTDKYLVLVEKGKLNVLKLENGDMNTYELPGSEKFMSCYTDYAFICCEKTIYRIDLSNGKAEKLLGDIEECNLINAISDDCAIIICYENEDSFIKFSVKTYAVYSNGSSKKLFAI